MKTTVDTFNSDHGTVEGARSCRQCLYEQKEIEINCQIFDINKPASLFIVCHCVNHHKESYLQGTPLVHLL